MPSGPVVTTDYVGCCICDGYAHSNFFDFRKPYLPIKRTLYCTWGSWAGNLIWDNPSLPSWYGTGACVPSASGLWSGSATIPFKYRTCDAYGYCNPTILDTTAECVVLFDCNGVAYWRVRAAQTCQCCLELDETQDACAGGTISCPGVPIGACFTCGPEFSAVLTAHSESITDGPCIGTGLNLWGHVVCDLQTSNCYITEA